MPSHIDRRRPCSDRQRGKHALLRRGQIGSGNLRPFIDCTQVSFGGPARALGVKRGSRRGLTASKPITSAQLLVRPSLPAPAVVQRCSGLGPEHRTSLLHPARSVISHRRSSSPLLGLLHRRRHYHCLCRRLLLLLLLLLLPTRPHLLMTSSTLRTYHQDLWAVTMDQMSNSYSTPNRCSSWIANRHPQQTGHRLGLSWCSIESNG